MTNQAKRLLVADDNTAHANVIRFTLERVGFDVDVAEDGQAAWDLLNKHDFDLVITDLVMPRMTGQELLQRMRNDQQLAQIPVIVLTAKSSELGSICFQKGASVTLVMHKPFSPRRVQRLVEECLGSCATDR